MDAVVLCGSLCVPSLEKALPQHEHGFLGKLQAVHDCLTPVPGSKLHCPSRRLDSCSSLRSLWSRFALAYYPLGIVGLALAQEQGEPCVDFLVCFLGIAFWVI